MLNSHSGLSLSNKLQLLFLQGTRLQDQSFYLKNGIQSLPCSGPRVHSLPQDLALVSPLANSVTQPCALLAGDPRSIKGNPEMQAGLQNYIFMFLTRTGTH